MQQRRDRLRKLLSVQGKLRELAELRLKRLRDEEARLKLEQSETLAALNGEGPLHGLFVEPMARRLQTLSGRLAGTVKAITTELNGTIAAVARVKHLERLTAQAELGHARQQERKGLMEVAETSMRKPPVSER